MASKNADIQITAQDLLSKFETNEEEANTLYLDKILLVSGLVDEIKADSATVSIYLKNKESLSGVICGFNKSEIDMNEIKKGDQVKIKGICSGYLLDVVLNKCSIVK